MNRHRLGLIRTTHLGLRVELVDTTFESTESALEPVLQVQSCDDSVAREKRDTHSVGCCWEVISREIN